MDFVIWYAFLLLIFSNIFLIIRYFYPIGKHRPVESNSTPPVSVIVCAKNEAENLQHNLPSILEQNYPEFEVIVMDDHSTDQTSEVMEKLLRSYPNLIWQKASAGIEKKPGKKWALREAIQKATFDHLLLTDADCRPVTANWIRHMSAVFSEKIKIVLGVGDLKTPKGFYGSLVGYETCLTAMTYLGFANAGMPYMGVGRNLAYRKSLITDCEQKGLNIASGDDDLFIQSVANSGNTGVCLHPESKTTSAAPDGFRNWTIQKARHYKTARYYSLKSIMLLSFIKVSIYAPHFLLLALFAIDHYVMYASAIWIGRAAFWSVEFNRIRRSLDISRRIYLLIWCEIFFSIIDIWISLKSLTVSRKTWK